MSNLSEVHQFSIICFALTACLLLVVEFVPVQAAKRAAAILAIAGVLVADYYLLIDVPEAGPLMIDDGTRAPKKERPQAAAEDEDDDGEGNERAEPERRSRGGNSTAIAASIADSHGARQLAAWITGQTAKPLALTSKTGQVLKDCPDCPEMVVMPAGESRIGADAGDRLATAAELPQRTERFWPGFAIGRLEITAAQWEAYRNATGAAPLACAAPRVHKAAAVTDEAAVCMSWEQAMGYAAWLGAKTGKRYRMPTAAEWEYAARTARTMEQSTANMPPADVAPAMAPLKMAGGVAEMVADCWHPSIPEAITSASYVMPADGCPGRVVKDGATGEDARWQRASARRAVAHDTGSARIGFRVLREME